MNRSQPLSRPEWGLFLAIAILGIVLVLYSARYGLGTTGDSVHYLMGAENILGGEGFGRTNGRDEVLPITMFAPFFSTVMAGFGLSGSLLEGTRLFQAVLFGGNILLVALITHRMTNSSLAALTGAVLLLFAKEVVQFHFWLMPEALYIFLSLLSIFLLGSYLAIGQKRRLILAAVVAGLATITRYVGVALVATCVVSVLILHESPWKRRLTDAFLAGGIGLAPFLIWIGRNVLVSGDAVNRAIGYHPVPAELIRAYRAQISYWFAPEVVNMPHVLRRAIMILIGILAPVTYFGLAFRDRIRRREDPQNPDWAMQWVLILYAAIYVITFVLNLTFLDALRDFNTVPRYLAPLFVIAIPMYVTTFHGLAVRKDGWPARVASLLVAGFFIVSYALGALPIVRDPIPVLGYTGIKMERPETVERLASINRSAAIISNDPELVYALSSRTAFILPIRYDANTGKERDDFEYQLLATREKLERGGMLVLFPPLRQHEMEVIDLLNVELIDSFYGSSFYAYPQVLVK